MITIRNFLQLISIISILDACAHYNSKTQQYEGTPLAPEAGNSYTADWTYGAAAGIALIFEGFPSESENKNRRVDGLCKVIFNQETQSSMSEEICLETFIVVKEGKNKSSVWVDSDGRFNIPINPFQEISLEAVNERYRAHSKPIKVDRPGKVVLTINLSKITQKKASN